MLSYRLQRPKLVLRSNAGERWNEKLDSCRSHTSVDSQMENGAVMTLLLYSSFATWTVHAFILKIRTEDRTGIYP